MSNFNYNRVILGGRITKELELKQSQSGTFMLNFSLAVRRRVKNADGEYSSDFIGVKAFGKTAEFINQYFKKGSAIFIEGEIQTGSWTDGNGNKRYSTDVLANSVNFVDSATESDNNDPYSQSPPQPKQQQAPVQPQAFNFDQLSADDDLPF